MRRQRRPADPGSVAHAKDRRQFDQPIAEFQLIQAMLAGSQADTCVTLCMILDAAARRGRGGNTTRQAVCAKMFAPQMTGGVAHRAVQICGGAGCMAAYPVECFYRDVRLFGIFGGTTQVEPLVIARELLKAADASITQPDPAPGRFTIPDRSTRGFPCAATVSGNSVRPET